jgi:hypothetical protein
MGTVLPPSGQELQRGGKQVGHHEVRHGYVLLVCGLFTACVSAFGFEVTLWGFLATHTGRALAVLLLWWHDEHQWRKSLAREEQATATEASRLLPRDTRLLRDQHS